MAKYKYYKNYTYKGKRIQAYGNTVADLADCMRKKERRIDTNTITSNIRFEDWCEIAIERYKPSAMPKTIKTLRSVLKARIYPYFEGISVSRIKTADCQALLNELSGMSSSYISAVRQALHFFFSYAVVEGIIEKDPTVHLVSPKGTRKPRRALTPEERKAVLEVAKTKRHYYIYLLMLLCGCRPSEAAECKGSDISKHDGVPTLHIRGQKTALSDRFVPIPKDLYSLIQNTPKNKYISPTARGNKQTSDKLRRNWKWFKNKLNIALGAQVYRNHVMENMTDIVPYCLRHEYCTDLARKGIDIRLAQRLMGHANVRMTANVYTNLNATDIISQTKTLAD